MNLRIAYYAVAVAISLAAFVVAFPYDAPAVRAGVARADAAGDAAAGGVAQAAYAEAKAAEEVAVAAALNAASSGPNTLAALNDAFKKATVAREDAKVAESKAQANNVFLGDFAAYNATGAALAAAKVRVIDADRAQSAAFAAVESEKRVVADEARTKAKAAYTAPAYTKPDNIAALRANARAKAMASADFAYTGRAAAFAVALAAFAGAFILDKRREA